MLTRAARSATRWSRRLSPALLVACGAGRSPAPTEGGGSGAPPAPVALSLVIGGGQLPVDATCRGAGASPGLVWSGLPAETRDLLVEVRSTGGTLHWVLWSILPDSGGLRAGVPPVQAPPLQGLNSAGVVGWLPPCAPPAAPDDQLEIRVLALSQRLLAPPTADIGALRARAAPLTIGEGALVVAAFGPEGVE